MRDESGDIIKKKCSNCGDVAAEEFVFGMRHVDYEGSIYFCMSCRCVDIDDLLTAARLEIES